MRLLIKYIMKELLSPFLFGVGIFLLVFIGGKFLFEITKLLVEQNANLWQAGKLFFYGLAPILILVFPMASLLSVILGLGRLSNDGEIVAFFTSGISLWKIVVPVVIFSLLVSLGGLAFNEYVVPIANSKAEELKSEIAKGGGQRENILVKQEEGGKMRFLLYAKRLEPNLGRMEGVIAIEFWRGEPAVVVSANEAIWKGDRWLFKKGEMQNIRKSFNRVNFEEKEILFPQSPQEIARGQMKAEEMSFRQLRAYIKRMGSSPPPSLIVQLHRKLADPFATLVLALLGIPFGLKPYRGKSVGVGLSVILIFAYYIVWHYTEVIGEKGLMDPLLSAYLPNGVGAIAGFLLLFRTPK